MVLTINSFISILQTINERGRQGERKIRILTQNTGSGEPRTDDSRQAAVMSEGHQSANGLPRPRPDALCRSCLWGRGDAGPGGGGHWGQAGGAGAASVASGFVISRLIRSDRGQARHSGHCPQQDQSKLGKIHLSRKCYIIEHQQMQIVHCVLNKHWSIFWLPVLFLLSIFDDVGYPK